jgi:hypothetical protein
MKLTKNHPLFPAFENLICHLSPENLTCDGELSSEEVKACYNSIMAEWVELEKQLGETVTEDDFWNAYNQNETLNDGEVEVVTDDDEHDQFRDDVDADADALRSAGFGTDEDYEHRDFDRDDF